MEELGTMASSSSPEPFPCLRSSISVPVQFSPHETQAKDPMAMARTAICLTLVRQRVVRVAHASKRMFSRWRQENERRNRLRRSLRQLWVLRRAKMLHRGFDLWIRFVHFRNQALTGIRFALRLFCKTIDFALATRLRARWRQWLRIICDHRASSELASRALLRMSQRVLHAGWRTWRTWVEHERHVENQVMPRVRRVILGLLAGQLRSAWNQWIDAMKRHVRWQRHQTEQKRSLRVVMRVAKQMIHGQLGRAWNIWLDVAEEHRRVEYGRQRAHHREKVVHAHKLLEVVLDLRPRLRVT